MKRYISGFALVLSSLLLLSACGSKEKATPTKASSNEVSQVAESNEAVGSSSESLTETILVGNLKEDAVVEGDKVSFFLVDVKGINDPSDVAKGIGDEGVVLNAEQSQVAGEFLATDFKAGQLVEVTSVEHAVMARSLPPQIPGSSIILIKKLEN